MKNKIRRIFVFVVLGASFVLMLTLWGQAPSEAEMQLMEYAKEKKIAYASYPDSLVRLLKKNPETKEFVQNYPFREEGMVDLSQYDAERGVPLFVQWDEQWGYLTYGGSYVGITGSGPMCLAMAGYYLSEGDPQFSPDRIAAFAAGNGYYYGGKEADSSLITQGVAALGLKATALARDERKIAVYLKNGDPIIASTGAGDFGNYIVLTGYDNGLITVRDPESKVNSDKEWPFEELSRQIKNLWVIQMDE